MEILNNWHKVSDIASEYDMQVQVDEFLNKHQFRNIGVDGWWRDLPKIVLREFRVPEIGRISDHVLLINNRRVVNIECKLDDIAGVICQAQDHLKWCDYSIICMPPDGRYIPTKYIKEIIEKGIGLWYWFKDIGIFEFINPKFNRNKDKELRKKIISRVNEKNPLNLFRK